MEMPPSSLIMKTGNAAATRAFLIDKVMEVGGFSEAYHETVFRCFRKDKKGLNQEVLITLYDAGKSVEADRRYLCVARTTTGVTATGEPSQYADKALENVNWGDLDK